MSDMQDKTTTDHLKTLLAFYDATCGELRRVREDEGWLEAEIERQRKVLLELGADIP